MSDEKKRNTNLKRYIAETSSAIRRKYRLLRRGRADEETELIRTLDPIVKPLETLVETSKENISSGRSDREVKKKDKRPFETESVAVTPPTEHTPSTPLPPAVQSLKLETVAETGATSFERLQKEINSPEGQKALKSYLSEVGVHSSPYIQSILYGKKQGFDQTYGVRYNGQDWFIGDSPVQIVNDIINVQGVGYLTTSGLLELLFKKNPDLDKLTKEDWDNYKEILINTNAHRQNYSVNKQINSNRGEKYVKVISRLFPAAQSTLWTSSPLTTATRVRPSDTLLRRGKKLGYGMGSIGVGETVVRYWNNPNELVDRLRLLIASKKAGNTSHDGETWALIDELRESGIIE